MITQAAFPEAPWSIKDSMYCCIQVWREKETEDGKLIRQTQCLAIGDGVDYEKLEDNPVIYPDGLPQGSSLEDFRDPKIWQGGRYFLCGYGKQEQ